MSGDERVTRGGMTHGELQVFDDLRWSLAPAVPACPSWCIEAAGHPFDGVDPTEDVFGRTHTAFEEEYATVTAYEQTSIDGSVELEPLQVDMWGGEGAGVTAVVAREAATQLAAAADRLDELTAAIDG